MYVGDNNFMIQKKQDIVKSHELSNSKTRGRDGTFNKLERAMCLEEEKKKNKNYKVVKSFYIKKL